VGHCDQIVFSATIMINTPSALIEAEHSLQQAIVDKAVAEEKFEIAADVLHDIGNAIVGFGSYLTRIKGSIDQDNPKNLLNLEVFFADRQAAIATAIGEAKADAVISMLHNIIESQKVSREEIQKSVGEQLNIITHIQEILNIQRQYMSGRNTNEKKATNLRGVVNDCLSMLFASLDKRGIKVSIDTTAESPIVYGDRTRLMQVVMNILKNSIEAIDRSATTKNLSISLCKEDLCLVLSIRDSGNGFDRATADRIFTRGFTTKSSGTGLGLHNCRSIVESHGGTFSISSEGVGNGALVMLKFKT
jgi:signal transduction histidine kinase